MAKSNSSISSREKIAVLMVALGNDIEIGRAHV